MIITISGKPGSGKSTLAGLLAKKLNMKRYSVGDFYREKAKKLGLTLEEFNKKGEKNFSNDNEVDEWQREIGKKEDNFIIDGRLSYHFIPNSVKIFIEVSPEVGARRIMEAGRSEEKMANPKEALSMWKERYNSDLKRYKKYYKINPYDSKQYDFVLDTTNLNIEQEVVEILKFLKTKHL